MQISRLFKIVYILLDKNIITAKELSEVLEVSVRTIYRDVETLSLSGIPIYMIKGKGGGISLLPDYILNKTILSEEEKIEILSALQSLSAATKIDVSSTLSKLRTFFGETNLNWIEIDYSDWYSGQKKFDLLKEAILTRKVIQFKYYNSYGEMTTRKAEPLTLWFKSKAWYLKSFCLLRQEARIFKLSRINNLKITDEIFEYKNYPINNMILDSDIDNIKIILKIDSSQACRVYDNFDECQILKNSDGNFIVTIYSPEDEWLYNFIISFGVYAEVLEPIYIRENIKDRLEKTLKLYL